MPGHGGTSAPLASAVSSRDDELLARAAQVDPEAFGVLYDRYVDRIYAYCSRRLQTRTRAEDATSQVFLRAFAGLPGYQVGRTTFRSWLFAIAYRVVIDCYRAARSELSLEDAGLLRTPGPGPEERALANEADRDLYALIGQLPAEQEQLIQLRLSGLTDHEIADVLGKSHGAVRTAQHRAIQRLKTLSAQDPLATGMGR
jgi:RNA polymerase sigma-70 factor, ECF subfamily